MIRTARIHVTTTISPEFREWLVQRNIKCSTALARGVRALIDSENPDTITNEELRNNIAHLQRILTRVNEEKYKLEEEVQRLKGRKHEVSDTH